MWNDFDKLEYAEFVIVINHWSADHGYRQKQVQW